MPIVDRIAALADEITAWRHDLHAHPELQYDVHRTAGFVAEKLRDFGCDEVATGIGRTGVVGIIRGRSHGSNRAIGLRADMDALPIQEVRDLAYRSTVPGRMHACGHDGHTAMLLGAAKYLAETRDFDGTAVMIFQPAEEGGGGGEAMVRDGMMERFGVETVYGLHNIPGLELGRFAIRPGPIMASTDRFTITIEGRGGHAAQPHLAIDSVLVASHIVVALQSVVARSVNPLESGVVSVCALEAGDAFNVLPQQVTMRGTMRALSKTVRATMLERIDAIVTNTAAAYGAIARVDYSGGYPVTENHPAEAEFIADVAAGMVGDSHVERDVAPMMAAEDFSYMLAHRPGAYIFMGNGDSAGLHHPHYDFNDAAIPYGASLWARVIETALPAR
ncbi:MULTISPECIES: M20 aminoacylase family protein [Methylobacterium]|uniref:Hippurate hydrolase n=1 Tax=Methylobacterium bullatum TaxID=570505 RepID=A0AAV4Z3W1_9HYPH|nr:MULTISPECIES: M20 aminoacylase family protein [Methylobacterium]KQP42051.1 amidohydrolase [Methylobacterium sp. Leaf106]MBD8904752.1 amidohydrolase [Methylobacterium bullatum]TXN30764.1 amidohydrolase [Methylobacterium sp. WL19]GJD38342.1 Hippurate hydrolase [Methylobacterium bullatum]